MSKIQVRYSCPQCQKQFASRAAAEVCLAEHKLAEAQSTDKRKGFHQSMGASTLLCWSIQCCACGETFKTYTKCRKVPDTETREKCLSCGHSALIFDEDEDGGDWGEIE